MAWQSFSPSSGSVAFTHMSRIWVGESQGQFRELFSQEAGDQLPRRPELFLFGARDVWFRGRPAVFLHETWAGFWAAALPCGLGYATASVQNHRTVHITGAVLAKHRWPHGSDLAASLSGVSRREFDCRSSSAGLVGPVLIGAIWCLACCSPSTPPSTLY